LARLHSTAELRPLIFCNSGKQTLRKNKAAESMNRKIICNVES